MYIKYKTTMFKIKLWSNAPGNIMMIISVIAMAALVIWGLVYGFTQAKPAQEKFENGEEEMEPQDEMEEMGEEFGNSSYKFL